MNYNKFSLWQAEKKRCEGEEQIRTLCAFCFWGTKPHTENVFLFFMYAKREKADQKDKDEVNIDFCNYYLPKSAKYSFFPRKFVSFLRNLSLKIYFAFRLLDKHNTAINL